MEKLKSCPFCGNTKLQFESCADEQCCNDNCEGCEDKTTAVLCSLTEGGCGASSGYFFSEEKAAEHWNRRK